jgi:hypothetical protein
MLRLGSEVANHLQINQLQWLMMLAGLIALIAARCLILLLFKTKFKSKDDRVKTMIVLGSGWWHLRQSHSLFRKPQQDATCRCHYIFKPLVLSQTVVAAPTVESRLRTRPPAPPDTAVAFFASTSVCGLLSLPAGGHTAEMLMLVSGLDKQYYSPRVYVVAETDKMSAKRALTREQEWSAQQVCSRCNAFIYTT